MTCNMGNSGSIYKEKYSLYVAQWSNTGTSSPESLGNVYPQNSAGHDPEQPNLTLKAALLSGRSWPK